MKGGHKTKPVVAQMSFAVVYFLQQWTFRTTADLVPNVHIYRKQTLLQKRTFGTTVDLVLNVRFCRHIFSPFNLHSLGKNKGA